MKQFFSSKVALQSLEMPLMKQSVGSKWFLWILAAGFLAVASQGCAEEVGDIDRTQTNKLEKSLLAGHWYYMQTVIDVPQQSAQGFIGLMNFFFWLLFITVFGLVTGVCHSIRG